MEYFLKGSALSSKTTQKRRVYFSLFILAYQNLSGHFLKGDLSKMQDIGSCLDGDLPSMK